MAVIANPVDEGAAALIARAAEGDELAFARICARGEAHRDADRPLPRNAMPARDPAARRRHRTASDALSASIESVDEPLVLDR